MKLRSVMAAKKLITDRNRSHLYSEFFKKPIILQAVAEIIIIKKLFYVPFRWNSILSFLTFLNLYRLYEA